MELNTILELVKAGFTKDEIMQMAQPAQTPPAQEQMEQQITNPEPVQSQINVPAQNPQPAPAQVVEPVAPAVPAPIPQPVQAPAEDQPSMADIMQSIAKLTSAVQANAIAQSVIPQGLQNPPSAEDMLAEIIRPTFKERG